MHGHDFLSSDHPSWVNPDKVVGADPTDHLVYGSYGYPPSEQRAEEPANSTQTIDSTIAVSYASDERVAPAEGDIGQLDPERQRWLGTVAGAHATREERKGDMEALLARGFSPAEVTIILNQAAEQRAAPKGKRPVEDGGGITPGRLAWLKTEARKLSNSRIAEEELAIQYTPQEMEVIRAHTRRPGALY